MKTKLHSYMRKFEKICSFDFRSESILNISNLKHNISSERLVSLYPNSGFITRENVFDMLLQKHAITEENLDEQEESDCFELVDRSDAPF